MDISKIRAQFPILKQKIYGKDLVYLDNAATTQKPQRVIDKLVEYYTQYNSNVHRGVHYLSQKATEEMEISRQKVADFINAKENKEIIFTKGTTDGINLIANAFGSRLEEGDEILITEMEHHSNLVPWHLLAERKKLNIQYIPINEEGELVLDDLENLMNEKTKLISISWVSNTLGTINPIENIIAKAKSKNIPILIDAAQAVQHTKVDVQKLGADFLAFSGHKMYGPTGVGILYVNEKWMDLTPYQGGGSMIKEVKMSGSTYADLPFRFEAGTPNIADNIALGAAIDFINEVDIDEIERHEYSLLQYANEQIAKTERVSIIGNSKNKAGAISLNFSDAHPYDVGELLDKQGIAVRTGHHCCQPIMDFYKIPGTLRLSFAVYNTKEELDIAFHALNRVLQML